MNWYRAKTILIILFLAADLFLLSNIVGSTRKQTTIAPEVITSTIQVMKNHNIEIQPSIIPSKTVSLPYAEADNVISDYDEFAQLFLGDSFTKSDDFIYKSQSGTIEFSGDNFSYDTNASPSPASIDEKSAQDIASNFLKSKGFDIKDAKVLVGKSGDGITLTFKNNVKSKPLFNSTVNVKISGNDVVSVSGSWFNVTDAKGQNNRLKAVTSTLIDFIPLVSSVPTQITELTLGYTVPDSNLYHKSASLVPVWQIKEANGSLHYPDARNPE